jgi:serine/threonine protein kinase
VSDPCNQAKSIFLAAIEEHAPEQWPGFLNQACAGDVRLRAEVEIDTRSDSYSLGMLLYELLAGVTPFDRGRMGTLGYDEMRRVIREEDPPSPSIRLSTLGQAAVTVSAERQSDPKRLCRLLRGELDWIVMKALEKDRTRRYETANELARDVDRYLHDEDVARLRGQGPGDPERLAALLAEQELGEDQVDGGFDAVPDRGEDL